MMRTSVPMVNFTSILRYFSAVVLAVGILIPSKAQTNAQPATTVAPQPQAPVDILGRNTPRSAVLGFLSAAAKRDDETAARYLNTRVKGRPASFLPSSTSVIEILLERLDRGKGGSVWLFSSGTLDSIPDLYNEVNTVRVEGILPRSLQNWLRVRCGPESHGPVRNRGKYRGMRLPKRESVRRGRQICYSMIFGQRERRTLSLLTVIPHYSTKCGT
jgi:hypothetical protein